MPCDQYGIKQRLGFPTSPCTIINTSLYTDFGLSNILHDQLYENFFKIPHKFAFEKGKHKNKVQTITYIYKRVMNSKY